MAETATHDSTEGTAAERTEPAERGADARIRSYRPLDHRDCRALWAELTEQQRRLYEEPPLTDPGAEFEHYLTRLELSGMWVADHAEAGVIGFVGLLLSGRRGEIEPIVVSEKYRSAGIGRALLDRVAAEARKRGLRQLSISAPARNADAIRSLHAAGYRTIEHVTVSLDLTDRERRLRDGIELHELPFNY